MRSAIVAFTLAAFIAGSPAFAGGQREADKWSSRLERTSRLLKDRQYETALPILEKLFDEMLNALGPGDETTYVLSIPLIQRAIAEAGQGDLSKALWHWHMAQTMYPKAADADLSMFGEAGAFLKANRLVDPTWKRCPSSWGKAGSPPVIRKRVAPDYPTGVRRLGEAGLMIVHVTVDTDGVPREPRVLKPIATPLVYSALEALRLWRFAPGTRNGVPVDSSLCLTMTYQLDHP